MNMKKLLKSLLAIAAAFLMVFSLGTAVNADGTSTTYNINVSDTKNTGSTYYLYKLLDLTYSETTENGETKKFYNYTLLTGDDENNANIRKAWEAVAGVKTDADIKTYFENKTADPTGLTSDNTASEMGKFAKAMYGEFTGSNAPVKATQTVTVDGSKVKSAQFTNVSPGYYLIVEAVNSNNNNDESATRAILTTVANDDVTVTTKEDVPTVQKKVQEKNDSIRESDETDPKNPTDWQDAADYDVNDLVPYQLTGTLPDDYALYDAYYYKFNDTLSKGLTFDESTAELTVSLYNKDTNGSYTKVGDFKKVEDYSISTANYSGKDTTYADGKVLTIEFANLKITSLKDSIKSDSKIIVTYKATLNESANIGSTGNPNEVTLTFSNNPYSQGTGETSTTPKDKVTVFTYEIIANKTDESGKDLNGAGFTLYKLNATSGKYEPVGSEMKGTGTNPMHTFKFTRVDAGEYKLSETTVPDGYHKADDLEFTVVADYDTASTDPELKSLKVKDKKGSDISGANGKFTFDLNSGSVTTTVKNTSGNQLPSTGGIGTTIFYVVGGGLVAVAAALLIAKKRASAE